MRVDALNHLPEAEAREGLLRCCGSRAWAQGMLRARPFADERALLEAAERVWRELGRADWLEAFAHHPRIGERQLREKFAATAAWASQEQKGTQGASEQTLRELASGNAEYERRFGHVFLVCATGRTADELLRLLRQRIDNPAETELGIAAGEQAKITALRLKKWMEQTQP
jgi:2-oxo-4-hydroxy-4-carboxy-5-ureidoimidazoline decarboxylase